MKLQEAIKLNYKQTGSGPVLVILHGLFGSLDNWQSMAKMLSEKYSVYCLDLRNHGKSSHSIDFSISLMAVDVLQFIENTNLTNVNLIGHSMGGKVALELLNENSTIFNKALILDIAPKAYARGHEQIFKAMFSLDLQTLISRKEADELLIKLIPDFTVRQFILKNLDRNKEGKFEWKINLDSIYKNYDEINKEIIFKHPIMNEVLFVKGSLSKYILSEDEPKIKKSLPNSQFIEVQEAGHWIHADKPKELVQIIEQFIQSNHY